MTENYLADAFKAFSVLNEDAFDTSSEGLDQLNDFIEGDFTDNIEIIDMNADTEAELEDSYVGKVILKCPVCASLVYKNADNIVVDDTSDVVNSDEECPYCHTINGFSIVGQVAEYCDKCDNADETTPEIGQVATVEISENLESKAEEESKGIVYDAVLKILDDNNFDVTDKGVKKYASAAKEYIEIAQANSDEPYSVEQWFEETKSNYPEDLKELKKLDEKLTESISDVKVQTATQEVTVSDGVTTIINKETDEEVAQPAEVIEPIDTTTVEEISDVQEDDTVDVEIEDFDENAFDELSEKYLKRIYENVSNYKTTTGSVKGNTLILEGLIRFDSGKSCPTKFLFEGKDITKTGKARFVGCNKHLCKGSKPFTIRGKVEEKKFITESFAYNYKGTCAKTGATERCCGTITRK